MKAVMKQYSLFRNEFSIRMREQFIEVMARMERTREKDGFDRLRFEYTQEMSKILQERIGRSQNPQDCQRAKYLVSYSRLASNC